MPQPATEDCAPWLIVDDEALIALLVEYALCAMGLATIGPMTRVARALEAVARLNPKGAVLDVNLAGEKVFPVAEQLSARGIPFLFVTGYGEDGLPPEYAGRPVVEKPFSTEEVQAAVKQLLGCAPAVPP